jgi:hypothetical protein
MRDCFWQTLPPTVRKEEFITYITCGQHKNIILNLKLV